MLSYPKVINSVRLVSLVGSMVTIFSIFGEKCVSAATVTYNFEGILSADSNRYDPVTNTTIDLSGLTVRGQFTFDPSAPVTTHEGEAAYYGQSPPAKLSFYVDNQIYETVGSFNGYSYVYLRNFPWYTPINSWDRYLVEVLGYTHNNEQQIFSVADFYDNNGDALSTPGSTPGLPNLSKFEHNHLYFRSYDTNLKRDLVSLSSFNTTINSSPIHPVPEPLSTLSAIAAGIVGAALKRKQN